MENNEIRTDANDSRCPNSRYPKQITAEMIPQGDDLETVKQRSKLLKEFYDWWFLNHPERKIHNTALDEDICVTYLSKHETSGQAARRYNSALAVLKLDYILENAATILSDPADKNTKAQKKFEKMLLMKCKCEGPGIEKLTVGVYKDTSHKEQYCITVIEADPKDSFKQSKKHGTGRKRKTNRRKNRLVKICLKNARRNLLLERGQAGRGLSTISFPFWWASNISPAKLQTIFKL